ncbi:hypothetical protein DJ531_11180 [Sulfolobus sp. A20-N-F6]|nr:hypothetical protein DJ532_14920 [Sulfolobus sp. A20-N-F8]TRM79590.1 hypothetical protein DJ528_00475 [Sulfolobus sp. B5]TRM81266.1 hypothetical protein DJ531_11180 [Sulfolobus sp. A20-N-F6]TRM98137.1 hypothetical protein DMP16_00085 [Sulfolobus sp. B1]TRN01734.1 hypothetical protein DJ527_05020 [Sulfolobus sp. F1]TRN03970.1 hypothetical protein DJ530_02025 [Sulfolobus sp. E1]
MAVPKGNNTASIDLGINMLATVLVDHGKTLFYRGSIVKSDFLFSEEDY